MLARAESAQRAERAGLISHPVLITIHPTRRQHARPWLTKWCVFSRNVPGSESSGHPFTHPKKGAGGHAHPEMKKNRSRGTWSPGSIGHKAGYTVVRVPIHHRE
ncbi:hypothetical protein AMELA_G00149910 [Ameiurus melas]|uniref:Uncharacterized protein n=1 Tax=Ameiurus melas TaxID=219545 RepID=A0A7J6AHJ5_AMEME|nr:hypothetical protein AMELA_G00149910 [Ameiurus melas]